MSEKLTKPRSKGDQVECMCCHQYEDYFDMNGGYCDEKNDFPVCDFCTQLGPIIAKDSEGRNIFQGYRKKLNPKLEGLSSNKKRFLMITKNISLEKRWWKFWE